MMEETCSCGSGLQNFTDEQLVEVIVKEVQHILSGNKENNKLSKVSNGFPLIPLGVSNRHIHLTEETFHKLFGNDTKFEEMRPLYQPGEFASRHTLTIVGTKLRSIQNVRILGPLRKYDQVEVSLTDAIFLGVNPPVTNSGSLESAAPLTLVGPKGSVYLEKCAIIANRHIHMTNKDAQTFGVKDGDFCRVKINSDKSTVFEDVLIRINDNWLLQIHLDTDDANAANVREETFVEFLGKM
ncbi:MAG: phosphate propanoyltransferase [Ignavibacteria bacterium]|jgi:putative phosphotransacetylase